MPRDARPSVPRVPSTPSASVHGPSPSWPGVSVWKPLWEALGTAEWAALFSQAWVSPPTTRGGHRVCSCEERACSSGR